MHQTTMGLVLRDVAYKEGDKILTVLTQTLGKVTVSARGCRRKGSQLAAGCQLLCWSEMVLYEFQGRWQLKEISPQQQFRGVGADLDRLSLGCYFAEVAECLAVEGLPATDLLSLVLNALYVLDQRPQIPLAQVKAAFELRCMCLAGYEPMIDGCAVCGRPVEGEGRFHLNEGVLHCPACRGEVGPGRCLSIAPAGLEAMRHIVWGDPKRLYSFRLDEVGLSQLAVLTEGYLIAQLERDFRTLDFYRQLTLAGKGGDHEKQ